MAHKENINKVHYDLSNEFENISITENADRKFGNHVRINIEDELELKLIIEKVSIDNDTFRWFYLSDPRNEETLVERKSTVETFTTDVKEIFEKSRFDLEYIKESTKQEEN
jgi:hypothetical protein